MRGKCNVYLDNNRHFNVENSLIIQTPDIITFVNINDGAIISKKGSINQVYYYKYFVICDTNGLYGVIRYDGTVVVPFEFYNIIIWDDVIKVQKYENSDYEKYSTIPK